MELENAQLKKTNHEFEQAIRKLEQKVELLTQQLEEQQPWSEMRRLEDIPPSKIKWNDIYSKDTVSEKEPYEFLLKCTDMKKDLPAALDTPSDTLSEMQKMILDNGIADLESLSSMFFGNIIAFLTNSLQSKTGKPGTYKFRVTPVVFCHPEDHRKNKYSDYIVLRLINKSVKVVVAIKKRVTPTVISAKSTHIVFTAMSLF